MPSSRTATPRRYLVLLPTLDRPVGGQNVLLWMIDTLRGAGYDVAALHGRRDDSYAFYTYSGARFYSRTLDRLFRRRPFTWGVRAHVRQILGDLRRDLGGWAWKGRRLPDWQHGPGDILIVPEFMYPEAVEAFPGRPCILAVQDVFGLMRASLRSHCWQGGAESFSAVISTSEASAAAAQAVLGAPVLSFRLPVCRPGLSFNPDKRLQIALMPRKRREEAQILQALVRGHPDLSDIPLVIIDRVPETESHRLLRESLIFLSLSEKEGFGMPPAEAMATGSLVIGYTGVGGEEYFNSGTGFPIPDGDIVAFVNRLADVVRTWRHDPALLETKRRAASNFIWSRYDEVTARQSLTELWAELDTRLQSGD